MKTEMVRFTLLVLFFLSCTVGILLPPVCIAQTQDYSTLNLPAGAIARFGTGNVAEVAFSPDGSLLAVASSIGVWLYDAETFDALTLLTGHAERVNAVAFSPDGTKASGSGLWSGTVKLWHPKTGKHTGGASKFCYHSRIRS